MKTEYIIIWAILFAFLLFWSIGKVRTYLAILKVKKRSDEIKDKELNEAISTFGYYYEWKQDIFSTTLHPWQREMGYSRLYDESALSLGMIIHCEPIEFEYNDKLYLIELWKGQYGMTTGGEVGIYQADKPANYQKGDYIFYKSITDDQLLHMSMTLYKKGKAIIKRSDKHWWLTAFELGEYSVPEDLSLKAAISFPNYMMRNAYVEALLDTGYAAHEIRIQGLTVSIIFGVPKTKQPLRKRKIRRAITAKRNRFFCKRYLKLTEYFEYDLDRIDFLRHRYTILTFFALRFSKVTKKAMTKVNKKYWKKEKKSNNR